MKIPAENDNLVEVQTKLGTVYVEPYDEKLREEADRIKVYDSNKRYLDYVSVSSLEPPCDDYYEREYNEFVDELKQAECLADLLGLIGCDWVSMSKDLKYISAALNVSTETVVNNEFVNRVGDVYIIVPEC